MAYLLDANVFIEANSRYYRTDICPGFWSWLENANAAERVFSIEAVANELRVIDDELKTWAGNVGGAFFLSHDEEMAQQLSVVSEWVNRKDNGHKWEKDAINVFLNPTKADYYLVAHALAYGHTIVTHETAQPNANKVKIPDVCNDFGIPCINSFAMLQREKACFVLGEI